jgi:hypothetical protein
MPVEEASDPQEEEPPIPEPAESAVAIGGVPAVPSSGSFHFMQESELEAASTPFEDGAEWVERSDAAGHPAEQQGGAPAPLDLSEDTKLVNGHAEESLPEVIVSIIIPPFSSTHLITFFSLHSHP